MRRYLPLDTRIHEHIPRHLRTDSQTGQRLTCVLCKPRYISVLAQLHVMHGLYVLILVHVHVCVRMPTGMRVGASVHACCMHVCQYVRAHVC